MDPRLRRAMAILQEVDPEAARLAEDAFRRVRDTDELRDVVQALLLVTERLMGSAQASNEAMMSFAGAIDRRTTLWVNVANTAKEVSIETLKAVRHPLGLATVMVLAFTVMILTGFGAEALDLGRVALEAWSQ